MPFELYGDMLAAGWPPNIDVFFKAILNLSKFLFIPRKDTRSYQLSASIVMDLIWF